MRHSLLVLFTVQAIIVVSEQAASGQPRTVDVRATWGYDYGLDDSPPHALVGGISVTGAVGRHYRLGAEVLKANLFGPYGAYKSRARLVRAVVEHELLPRRRLNPYWVVGFGLAQYRDLIPVGFVHVPTEGWIPSDAHEWDVQTLLNVTGGIGLRMHVTDRVFLAPEVRFGIAPLVQSAVAVGVAF